MTTSFRLAAPVLTGSLFLAALTASTTALGQELGAVQAPSSPLILRSRGSFLVGGENVTQTPTQLSYFTPQPPPAGTRVTINQRYVEYMVPMHQRGAPVVMLHGATLTGKSYDTTPDGRMGWFEYFVRQGHPTYIPDQVSRCRSGFDISTYNDVRAGVKPLSALPNFWRFGDELAWTQFRFGPTVGTPFPDEQFPVEAAGEFSRQAVPDLNYVLPNPNPTIAATARLGAQLGGAVLMGHSQTGTLPLDAALAKIPILAVFGDHLDTVTGTVVNWQNQFNDCQAFLARVRAVGGVAEMLHPPTLGIRGNSHMIMMDKNNLQIADLILTWIGRNTRAGSPASH